MNLAVRVFLHLLLICSVNLLTVAQNDKEKLQKSKQKLEEEINYTNKLLEETQKTKQNSVNEVVILRKKISNREELIQTIQNELATVNDQSRKLQQNVTSLNKELEGLKKEYAHMIVSAYRNRNAITRLMFIFSSSDFNQAYQRMKYFQQYSFFRKNQAEMITKKQQELSDQLVELEKIKKEKTSLLHAEEREMQTLSKEKSQKDATIQNLSKKEKQLKKTLKEKQESARKLQKAIEAIIAEEIRKAREKKSSSASNEIGLTPEELELSNVFSNNRGKLPWPSERGIVSNTFGVHEHAVLKGIQVKNNGIDILTSKDSEIRAVFDGTVTKVISIPNYQNVVIIRHGEYLTVYSNLEKTYVTSGDKVSTKQVIGKAYTNEEEAKTEIHFELWKGKQQLDPESWLAK